MQMEITPIKEPEKKVKMIKRVMCITIEKSKEIEQLENLESYLDKILEL